MSKFRVVKNETSGMFEIVFLAPNHSVIKDEQYFNSYKYANDHARSLNAAVLVKQAVGLLEGIRHTLEFPARREFAKLETLNHRG